MARTVIVGDVHGCTSELEDLLEAVRFGGADQLVLVGDLVVRGPDPHGTLALVRSLGGRAVRGNHEGKLLAWRRHHKALGPEHERAARALSEGDWQMLEMLPFWLDLPAHGVRVVHAGVVPGLPIHRVPPEALTKMRSIDDHGHWSDDGDAGPLWGTKYTGPPHVVVGHNAHPGPPFHPWATGIDTGCVYGGRLTAMVLDEGEAPPRGAKVRRLLQSVPARRKYNAGKGPLGR